MFSSLVQFQPFGSKSLTFVNTHRANLEPLCLVAACGMAPSQPWCSMSPRSLCGFTSLPKVPQESPPPLLKQPSHNLSAASKMSVSAAEVCFTVTDIIALNFLLGCYQSVTDTLGNGAL